MIKIDKDTEHHYYITPPELETKEECWQNLSDYMNRNAHHKFIYLREHPQVYSEFDFDTKKDIHRGMVRFSVLVYDNDPSPNQ